MTRRTGSPALPTHLVEACRFSASRYDLVASLPSGGRVAEVGTYRGNFARHILEASKPAELHLIDLDFSLLDRAVENDPRVSLHRGQSHELLTSFPDSYFDWVYIDADHTFEATTRDARAAAPKVKADGYLVFNDFAHVDQHMGAYGVHRAVVEFAIAENWRFAWFAYSGAALYDVALKRSNT